MADRYLFTNILGSFVFNTNLKLIDKISFKSIDDYKNKENVETKLKQKHPKIETPSDKQLPKILEFFKKPEYFHQFHEYNLKLTKENIKNSVNEDNFIIQTISNIEELDKTCNLLTKRLREWYGLYNPETSKNIEDHEAFVKTILKKDKKTLLKELDIKESMGADLGPQDMKAFVNLAETISSLFELKIHHKRYLESIMQKHCPNLLALTGALIGAKLLEHAGSLKRLALFPSSTVQLLGAEKALFRHMRDKHSPPPKYGVIMNHPLIAKAKKQDKGKASRSLADKIAIAVKVDLYKGEFIGDTLKKKLEEKFK